MKFLLVLVAVLVTSIARAEAPKFLGTFESVRMDILMGLPLPESVTAKSKDMFAKMAQVLVITEKDLSLNVGSGGGIYMTYTAQGDFLLGKTMMGKSEMFYPIYVKDADTLFMAGQKFSRKKDDSK